jgi:molybdenum cofactor cytidylyltransferase
MMGAVVLAAGQSRRMGTSKLLLPLGDRPVIARIVDEVLDGPIDHAVVVVGGDGDRIRQALAGRAVAFVTNPVAEAEMLNSVRCGLRALPLDWVAALIVLGDQPGLTAGLLSLLVKGFRQSRRGLVVPVHQGRRGHPLLVAKCYQDEVLHQHAETGLRGLLQAHPDDVLEVEAGSAEVLEDMDEPADYTRLAAKFTHGSGVGP